MHYCSPGRERAGAPILRHPFSKLCGFAAVLQLSSFAQITPDEIIRRAAVSNERDWAAGPEFSYTDRDIETKGELRTDRTFAVRMMVGTPCRSLIAVDGRPLSFIRQHEEEQKEVSEEQRRKNESQHDRQRRIAQYRQQRDHDHLLMTEMTRAFTFKLVGEEQMDGRPVRSGGEPSPRVRASESRF